MGKKRGGVSVTGAALNTGREEQISWNEIRSLSGHRFRQVNSSSGDIYHQTYCFAATGSGAGEGGGDITKGITQQTKLSPRQVQRVKRCAATTQYCLLFLGLFPCGAKIRSYPSWPPSATWWSLYGPTQYVHRLHQTAHKSNAKEPISCYLHE